MRNYKYFTKTIFWLIGLIALGAFLFLLSRVAFILAYADFKELGQIGTDIIKAFAIGLRFDIKVLTLGLSPLILISFVSLITGSNKFGAIQKFFRIYGFIILSIYVLLIIIDYYFYSFYGTRISIIIFGFVEDDTAAVLKTIWSDFPIISITLGLVVGLFLLYKLCAWVAKDRKIGLTLNNRITLQIVAIIIFLGVYFVGMRGTMAIIPLDGRHATFSENAFANMLANNSVYALKTAITDKKKEQC